MGTQAPGDGTVVPEVLALLHDLPIITAVVIQAPDTHGSARITVRKTAQQRGRRTQYRYSWEARAQLGGHSREWGHARAYGTAEAAYQAAVQAVQTALRDQTAEVAHAGG